jgi:hypothetical protein
MQKWVRYVDIVLLVTALAILFIDFGIKQDILKATREFYVGREQAEGHKGRNNSDSDLPGSVLPVVSDDSEPVEDGTFLESVDIPDSEASKDYVQLSPESERYTRSANQGIPRHRDAVGS